MKNEYLGFNSEKNLVDSRKKKGKSIERKKDNYLSPPKTKITFGSSSGHQNTDIRNYGTLKSYIDPRESKKFYQEQCLKCKKIGEPTIKTVDSGTLCFPCYQNFRRIN